MTELELLTQINENLILTNNYLNYIVLGVVVLFVFRFLYWLFSKIFFGGV